MEKFLTKENIIIAIAVFVMVVQSNYFATKLDLANLKLEMSEMKQELKTYTDNGDKSILSSIEAKLQAISNKIDRIR